MTRRQTPQRPKQRTKKQPTPNTPKELARAAIAHDAPAGPSGDKVKVSLTLTLSRAQAERLTAVRGLGDDLEPFAPQQELQSLEDERMIIR